LSFSVTALINSWLIQPLCDKTMHYPVLLSQPSSRQGGTRCPSFLPLRLGRGEQA